MRLFGRLELLLRVVRRCAIVALLFVLQSSLIIASTDDSSRHSSGAEVVSSISIQNCDARNQNETPAREHRKHVDCCVLCQSASGNNDDYFCCAALFDDIVFPAVRPAVSFVWLAFDRRTIVSTGLNSSWSQRAPPIFS